MAVITSLRLIRNAFLLAGQLWVNDGAVAESTVEHTDRAKAQSSVSLAVTEDSASKWQLEVRQMPLAKVLAALEKETGIPIHYSVLPEGRVSATCVGMAFKMVLECLLNHKVDMIVRYAQRHTQNGSGAIAEVWILGARLDNDEQQTRLCVADDTSSGSIELKQASKMGEADLTDALLLQAKSSRPEERAEAIGALLAAGQKGDPRVKAALEEAMNDADDGVRAQAISTLAHREGSGTAGAIREALQDHAPDVRMMAVDGITDDISLLQQAVNDSDETVRELAAMKLEELLTRSQPSP